MKRKNLFVAISLLLAVVVFNGCGATKIASDVATDQMNQFEQYLKDNTVLPRANMQLTEAKKVVQH